MMGASRVLPTWYLTSDNPRSETLAILAAMLDGVLGVPASERAG
jgi:hypothetical protein